jgi:hypothetical protein
LDAHSHGLARIARDGRWLDKLMDWGDIIASMDANEKNALTRKRAAMLDEMPYSN